MTSTSDVINATRRWAQSNERPEMNRLTAQINAAATSASFDFPLGSIVRGAVLAVDLEEVLVWASTGSVADPVQRGWNGSTAATHSAGAVVEVNPQFSAWRIFNEINAELNSLSPQIYRVDAVSTTATIASSYNLDSDVLDVLSVQYGEVGPSIDWPYLRRWSFLSNQDTSIFASGKALRLYAMPDPGRTLRIVYAAALGTLSALTDDVEAVTGLPASALDIPAIGAAARLLSAREAKRSQLDMQPEPRQAQDVPPGTARSAASQLFALRDRRIKEEAAKLSRLYPSHIRRAV